MLMLIIQSSLEIKNNSKNQIGYLDEVIRPLVLILLKMSKYVKNFIDKGGDENKNNKLMSLCIDDDTLLEKYETIWAKIEDFKNIELDTLPIYDDRYTKT